MTLPLFRKNQKIWGLEKRNQLTMNDKQCKSHGSNLEPQHCDANGPSAVKSRISCPCCNRQLKQGREIVGETNLQNSYGSIFRDDGSGSDTETSSLGCSEMDDEDSITPGTISGGVAYTVTETLAQGWMHKKGTGKDWIGSRAWKPRWAVLSLASLPCHDVEVPILQIFWHPGAPTPSTVIHLDSTIVLPQDLPDKRKWSCFRLEIRHVKKSVDEDSLQVTRSFSCPRDARDLWCQVINEALLKYEKDKALARRRSSYISLLPPRWRSPAWTADAHPSAAKGFSPIRLSPPSSPGSPPKDLPRHEPALIGESILDLIMEY